jgi:hypothetical protein
VARAIASPQAADLAAVGSVLHQAAAAVEALIAAPSAAPAATQRLEYFPPSATAPTAAELEEADRRWQEALARGRHYRDEARAWVGPLLTPAQTAERLGVSAVSVSKWRRQGKLLGLRFDEHQYLYPLFQFVDSPLHGERGVLRHLDAVLGALGDRTDWEKALFLLAPLPALDDRRPLDVLRAGATPATLDRIAELARYAGEMGR